VSGAPRNTLRLKNFSRSKPSPSRLCLQGTQNKTNSTTP
jgi:hypothetical protein